jgi:rieske iron-sulfur protein
MKIRGGGVDQKFRCGCRIERRVALGMGICFTLAPGLAFGQADPTRERPREGDVLVAADSDKPTPLVPGDLEVGAKQTMVWPMDATTGVVRNGSRLNKVLLLRLDPAGFDPATVERAAGGVVAYSAVCTHAGCDVITWHADRRVLECPCHNSVYDPMEAGKVVSGPAPRPLPALPLQIADGRLVVAKPFTGRAGFQQV